MIPRPRPVQFDWQRHWKKKVAPHLENEAVQACLDLGMRMLDPNWRRGDPPYVLGSIPLARTRIVPGKLSWYRPYGRCHWIAFFSLAIGVINYPHLDWRFVSGDLHTVPVGYSEDGRPRVVMDILLFDSMSAEESVAFTKAPAAHALPSDGWEKVFEFFLKFMVPILRASIMPRSREASSDLDEVQRFLEDFFSHKGNSTQSEQLQGWSSVVRARAS